MSEQQNEKVVFITESELDNLIYYTSYRAAKRANDKLFSGLAPFLYTFGEEHLKIMEELDYIKTFLQMDNNKVDKEEEKLIEKNERLSELAEKIFNNKANRELVNALKDELENNYIKFPQPKVEISTVKKEMSD